LNLEGAHSALPVWAEFMKRAHQHREYRTVTDFQPPAGVVSTQIDPASGQLATAACPKVRTEYFIEGTQPVELCRLHGGGGTQVASWETQQPVQRRGEEPAQVIPGQPAPPGQNVYPLQQRAAQGPPPSMQDAAPPSAAEPPKKKSFFQKLRGIFR
jgi:penicillin-binding protein 1B